MTHKNNYPGIFKDEKNQKDGKFAEEAEKLIYGPVGNNLANDRNDVLRVKSALHDVDMMKHEAEPHGYAL